MNRNSLTISFLLIVALLSFGAGAESDAPPEQFTSEPACNTALIESIVVDESILKSTQIRKLVRERLHALRYQICGEDTKCQKNGDTTYVTSVGFSITREDKIPKISGSLGYQAMDGGMRSSFERSKKIRNLKNNPGEATALLAEVLEFIPKSPCRADSPRAPSGARSSTI